MALKIEQNSFLRNVTSVDQQKAEFLIGHLTGAFGNGPILIDIQLVGSMQHGRQAVIFRTDAGICQLPLPERDLSLFAWTIHDQGAGLLREVDQVKQLSNRKVTQIAA